MIGKLILLTFLETIIVNDTILLNHKATLS